ncbi:MAG: NAD kinase [Bacteroidia bacterium]|nr:NAD kinase [Bacteroidia bacterium]
MKIALFGRPFDVRFDPQIRQMLAFLETSGFEIWLHEGFYQFLSKHYKTLIKGKVFKTIEEIETEASMLLSVGGDGTMLESAKLVGKSKVPVLGINTGRLGFLSSVAVEDIEKALNAVKMGQFDLEERSMLQLVSPQDLFGPHPFALNELTVYRRDSASMITIHTYIDGNFLNSYWADGLIISTPTGSTGYSLSCGGPIIHPLSESFVITPIAPHNLNVRPFVVPDNSTIRIKVEGRKEKFIASLDSYTETISSDTELVITKSNTALQLVRLKDEHFFRTLTNKLNWGLDKRN